MTDLEKMNTDVPAEVMRMLRVEAKRCAAVVVSQRGPQDVADALLAGPQMYLDMVNLIEGRTATEIAFALHSILQTNEHVSDSYNALVNIHRHHDICACPKCESRRMGKAKGSA